MREKEIEKELLKAASKTFKALSILPGKIESCDKFPATIYDDYIDMILPEDAKNSFEDHCPDCLYCLSRLHIALEADEKAQKIPLLSEIGQKHSLKKTLDLLDKMRKREGEAFLLAAAEKKEPKAGSACGIALDLETRRGSLIECIATVGDEKEKYGVLKIIGREVEEVEDRGRRIKGTAPLKLLEKTLSSLFSTSPILRAWSLKEKDIHVQIKYPGEGYLAESGSLALAVVMSIIFAIEGKRRNSIAFSADLDLAGNLRAVGELAPKLKIAEEKGIKEIIFPEENSAEYKRLPLDEKAGIPAVFLNELERVIDHLGIKVPDERWIEKESMEIAGREKRPVNYLKKIAKFGFIFLLIALVYPVVSLMIAFYLRPNFTTIFYYICATIFVLLSIPSCIWLFVRRKRVLICAASIFSVVCLGLFVMSPYVHDKVDMYNKVSLFIQNRYLAKYFTDIPNYPVMAFRDELNEGNLEGALMAAKKIPAGSKEYIQEVFDPLVRFMMEKNYQEIDEIYLNIEIFLKGVEKYRNVQEMRKKIYRGLITARHAAERYDNQELLRKIQYWLTEIKDEHNVK